MPIATLTDLGQDLEVSLPQSSAALAEVGSLTAEILVERIGVFGFRRCGRRRVLGFELSEAILACVYIGKQVIVVVKEV